MIYYNPDKIQTFKKIKNYPQLDYTYKNIFIVELIGNFYEQEYISVYSTIDNCLDDSTYPSFITYNNIFNNNINNHKILDKLWRMGIF